MNDHITEKLLESSASKFSLSEVAIKSLLTAPPLARENRTLCPSKAHCVSLGMYMRNVNASTSPTVPKSLSVYTKLLCATSNQHCELMYKLDSITNK